jgi:peptidoglycan-N-acetylglucosamine deacetylase
MRKAPIQILFLLFLSLLLMACERETPARAPDPQSPPGEDVEHGGEIALTFDDAPNYDGRRFTGLERTHRILDALSQEGVQGAVFFCNTRKLDRDAGRERLELYARAGHGIANHTHSHLDLNKTPAGEYIEDIRKADEILRKLPGFVPLFRYPYSHEGSTEEARREVRDAVARMGYRQGYFTVDAADWYVDGLYATALKQRKTVDEDELRKRYLEATARSLAFYDDMARSVLGRSPKHVIVLHESDINALFLSDLIRSLKSQDWKIIPAEEAFADPVSKQIPRGERSQFRLNGLAEEEGYEGPLDNPWAEPAKLDALFAAAFRGGA